MAESQCLSRFRNELELRRKQTKLQLVKQSELEQSNEKLNSSLTGIQEDCEDRSSLNFNLRKANQEPQHFDIQESVFKIEQYLTANSNRDGFKVALPTYKFRPNTVIQCKGCKKDL